MSTFHATYHNRLSAKFGDFSIPFPLIADIICECSPQVSPGAQDGVRISHNWVHDSPKKGIRFDGDGHNLPDTGVNGYVGFNVVWNIEEKQEIYPKGDYHTVVNNVAWDDRDEEDCTLCVPPELHGTEMNSNTLVANNGASKFEGGGGTIENNYESQDVKRQMVDTDNSDFRPVPGGGFISQGLNSMHFRFLRFLMKILI